MCHKTMKLTKATTELICELEYIIGSQCYNPNSVNGYTMEEGRKFRYPVSYENEEGKDTKTRHKISDIDSSKINTIRYKFGSNNLNIGIAIKKVLETLENEYGLDINELIKSKKKEETANTPTSAKVKPVRAFIVRNNTIKDRF